MYKKLLMASLALTLWSTTGHTMPSINIDAASPLSSKIEQTTNLHLVGQKQFKNRKAKVRHSKNRGAKKFAGNGGGVKDTCPGGDHGCIKDLKANCDKAGGGLSTEPDGGVDCFVVGIHDQ